MSADTHITRHDYSLPGLTGQVSQMLEDGTDPSVIYEQLRAMSPTEWGAGVGHDHTIQLQNDLRILAGWSDETEGSPFGAADWGAC